MFKALEFKSSTQSELFDKIMHKMDVSQFDRYRTSLALLWSATYKEELLSYITEDGGVKADKLSEVIREYTNAEKSLIRFGLQCFNERFDSISLPEVLESLDTNNQKIVKQAIEVRYNFG